MDIVPSRIHFPSISPQEKTKLNQHQGIVRLYIFSEKKRDVIFPRKKIMAYFIFPRKKRYVEIFFFRTINIFLLPKHKRIF